MSNFFPFQLRMRSGAFIPRAEMTNKNSPIANPQRFILSDKFKYIPYYLYEFE